MSGERVAHWLRANRASRLPRRLITLDSEAHVDFDGLRQQQSFRLAVAAFDRLDADAQPLAPAEWCSTDSTAELWAWVAAHTAGSHRTVCFAHHLSYDLRLTRALEHLPALGFELRQAAVSEYGPWVYLRRGDRSLYLVDSLSHLPASLERIAGLLNRRRPRLPDFDAPDEEWMHRCRADVRVLREALLRYLGLLREHDLGDFRTSGAGQASAAFRHRFLEPQRLLVHADTAVLARERRACWAGRAEVWRHGPLEGPLYEYDYDAAYARIALEAQLPVRLLGEFYPRDEATLAVLRDAYCCLHEVEVWTDQPLLPTELEDRIVWPIGTFTTTAWDCELAEAEQAGALIRIHRTWCYQRNPLLASWAAWILEGLEGRELGADPLGRLVVKEWSRALIGRFGLRYPLLKEQGELETDDLLLRPVADELEGRTYMQLQVGRRLYEQTERVESPNSTPAIMGYVMALARVRLWRAMRAAGFANLASVDTDGLIATAEGERRLEAALALGDLPGLRRKATYRRGEFRGPRNLDLDEQRRVAGVPRKAERLEPGVYRGEVWESLPTALRRRRPSTVLVHERTFQVAERDPRRQHLADGQTAPHLLADGRPVELERRIAALSA